MKPLEEEFQYYIDKQDELVKKYNGKYIVIKNCKVIDAYDSQLEAVNITKKNHKPGSFLVHKCGPGLQNYTQTFHKRVTFS